MPYLIYAPATGNQKVYQLTLGVNTIGRQMDNTIALIEQTVSRYHAQIHVTPDCVTVHDLGSRNHTFVNGMQIGDIYQICEGDQVAFGSSSFKFVHHLTTSGLEQFEAKQQYLGNNFKQIPIPQVPEKLENLLDQQSSDDSVLNFNTHTQEHQVNKLKILLEISKQLCSPNEPNELLQKILDLLFQIMKIDRAVILLVDEDSQKLEAKAVKSREYIHNTQDFYSRKIVNLAYESGDAIITENPQVDFNDSASIVRSGIENCMCVPLKNYKENIGVLYVDNLSPMVRYTGEDLEFLSALANQATAAIHMFREFHKREQKLKQQVLSLQIQIDQSKKESEVAEIVGGDFFQNLQQRAERLRNNNNIS